MASQLAIIRTTEGRPPFLLFACTKGQLKFWSYRLLEITEEEQGCVGTVLIIRDDIVSQDATFIAPTTDEVKTLVLSTLGKLKGSGRNFIVDQSKEGTHSLEWIPTIEDC